MRIERGEGTIATMIAAMTALGLPPSLTDAAIATTPPSPTPTARLFHGDCRTHMREFAQQGLLFDAVICDPPYHLSIARRFGGKRAAALKGGEPGSDNPYRAIATGFLGQVWDGGGIAFDVETWRAAYAVLKPGGHLVAFGGPRTFHRLAVAIEDAGFEIRDQIMWLFGSGFPKSLNLRGKHAGRGTALKPGYEPIIIARRPIAETSVASNVVRFGTGAINIDACRVPYDEQEESPSRLLREGARRSGNAPGRPKQQGRTITNRISAARYMEPRSGEELGRWPANVIHDGIDEAWGRYFYCAKASKADRGPGNSHPTVKPADLMKYLVRLVTPPGGVVFDPFMGSGSTGIAAIQEGFSFLGCEQQDEYVEIARGRIAKVLPRHADVRPADGSLAIPASAVRSAS